MKDLPNFLAYAYSSRQYKPRFFLEPKTTHLECKHIVGKYDHLVASALMIVDQELTCLNLVWVHGVQKDAFARRIP